MPPSLAVANLLVLITYSGSTMPIYDNSYLYGECNVVVNFTGLKKTSSDKKPGKQQEVNTKIECNNSEPHNDHIVDLCDTDKSKIEKHLGEDDFDCVDINYIGALSKRYSPHLGTMVLFVVLWVIYMGFWIFQIVRILRKSSLVISD